MHSDLIVMSALMAHRMCCDFVIIAISLTHTIVKSVSGVGLHEAESAASVRSVRARNELKMVFVFVGHAGRTTPRKTSFKVRLRCKKRTTETDYSNNWLCNQNNHKDKGKDKVKCKVTVMLNKLNVKLCLVSMTLTH